MDKTFGLWVGGVSLYWSGLVIGSMGGEVIPTLLALATLMTGTYLILICTEEKTI